MSAPVSLLNPKGEALENKEIGDFGEELAANYLRCQGCKVLYRNYRAPKGGEVDIVCRDDEVLGFVEVKTRTSDLYGRPASAVNLTKQQLIMRGAASWIHLLDHPPDLPFRFDIVEILLSEGEAPNINWIRGAFTMPKNVVY